MCYTKSSKENLLAADKEPQAGAVFNIGLLVLLMWYHQKWTQELFAIKSNYTYLLYAILAVAFVTIPLHYHLKLPVFVYMIFIPVSVLWQNYITFGLLQNYLRTYVSKNMAIGIIAVCFILAHILFVPNFITSPILIAITLIMALLFAYIREKTGTLH